MPGMPGDAFDVVVLGAGTGGYSTALRAAQLGLSTAIVEKDDRLGGTCLLRGCIPTKALLQSAAILDDINRSETFGIKASGEADWPGIQAYKEKVVDKLTSGLAGLIKSRKIEIVKGTGRLGPNRTVEVDGRTLQAKDVVLATGSYPRLLPGLEITERVITSDEALELGTIPASAVVIGAGAVGVEFASVYRSLGAETTVIEALPRLVPLEDEDLSKELARAFRKRKIASHVGAKVEDVKDTGKAVEVTFSTNGKTETVTADICLVAIGRGPVTKDLGFEEAGVKLDDRGYVVVNQRLQTDAEGVWAVGDVIPTLQLAHVSFAEGIACAERIAGQDSPEIDYVGIPRVTYCSPEVASVGLTEAQAKERGLEVTTSKFNLQGLGKANIVGEGGLCKLVVEVDGPIVGVHLLGPHVTDLVAEAELITNWEALPSDVAALIHPHPSLSEAIGEAAMIAAGKPFHAGH
jgi:dihydrolipoamide dehydrogenase